jgi:hypothetical protein
MSLMDQPRIYRALPLAAVATLLGSCAGLNTPAPDAAAATTLPAATPQAPDLTRYLDTLAEMAPGDPARQQATLDAARVAVSEDYTASNRLRFALALGCAGHADSDPIEAKRLMTELLASDHGLQPVEVELATAFLREFDARVALFAELGRQRKESERQVHDANSADSRAESLAMENARLRRALAAAERKLAAVAEMERSLLEQAAEPTEEPPPPPQP